MGLHDSSEFDRWRREMNEKDEIERLEHVQKKKIEMEMAREEAILAQERQTKENKILVMKMKEESAIRGDEIERNVKEDFSKRKDVIESVH